MVAVDCCLFGLFYSLLRRRAPASSSMQHNIDADGIVGKDNQAVERCHFERHSFHFRVAEFRANQAARGEISRSICRRSDRPAISKS